MVVAALSGSIATALSTALVINCVGCKEPLALQPAPLGVTGDVVGQSNRRVMQLRVADPVLCADFNTVQSDSNVRLRLVDSNQLFVDGGDGRGFRGALPLANVSGGSRLIIDPADANKRIINVATQATLKCSVFPGGVLPVIQPAASSLQAPEGIDLIFANGLETVVGTDLVTTVSTPASARAGDAVLYTIRVLAVRRK